MSEPHDSCEPFGLTREQGIRESQRGQSYGVSLCRRSSHWFQDSGERGGGLTQRQYVVAPLRAGITEEKRVTYATPFGGIALILGWVSMVFMKP